MGSKKIEEWSTEKLKSTQKTYTSLMWIFGILLIAYIGFLISFIVRGNWDTINLAFTGGLVAVVGGSLPIMNTLKNIKEELKKREGTIE